MHLSLVTDTIEASTTNNVPTAQLASIVLGLLMPFIISTINNPKFTPQKKRYVAITASVLVGVLNLIVQSTVFDWTWSVSGVASNLVLVLGAAQAAYTLVYKPTGVADKVEQATSPSTAQEAA